MQGKHLPSSELPGRCFADYFRVATIMEESWNFWNLWKSHGIFKDFSIKKILSGEDPLTETFSKHKSKHTHGHVKVMEFYCTNSVATLLLV